MKVKSVIVEYGESSVVDFRQELTETGKVVIVNYDEYGYEICRISFSSPEDITDFIQRLTELKKLFK